MMVETVANIPLEGKLLFNYFKNLVNLFFKILPMRENNEESLPSYLISLRDELLGCKSVVVGIEHDPYYMTLINILQFLIDTPECSVVITKRNVFHAISICNKFKQKYCDEL